MQNSKNGTRQKANRLVDRRSKRGNLKKEKTVENTFGQENKRATCYKKSKAGIK